MKKEDVGMVKYVYKKYGNKGRALQSEMYVKMPVSRVELSKM